MITLKNVMLCACVCGPTIHQAKQQIIDSSPFVDLIELRLDYLKSFNINNIETLIRNTKPAILTFKNPHHYPKKDVYKILILLASLNPAYLDIDYLTPLHIIKKIKHDHPNIKIIYSYHGNYNDHWSQIFTRLPQNICHYYKIALNHVPSYHALQIFKKNHLFPPNTIFICMGEEHSSYRALATLNNPINYVSAIGSQPSASGQLSLEDYRYYNYHFLSSKTDLYGLLGSPVSQSISHKSHNFFFKSNHLKACYIKIPTPPDQLDKTLYILRNFPIRGLSITAPLKQHAMQYVEHLDTSAQIYKSINTIVFKNGTTKGYNTDGPGAYTAITKHHYPISNLNIAILGAGNTAQTLAILLKSHQNNITIFNRSIKKARILATAINGTHLPLSHALDKAIKFDFIINTIPKGLLHMPLASAHMIMDVNTQPKNTLFIQSFPKNTKVIYGYELFIEQALLQFKLWFPENINATTHLLFKAHIESILNLV